MAESENDKILDESLSHVTALGSYEESRLPFGRQYISKIIEYLRCHLYSSESDSSTEPVYKEKRPEFLDFFAEWCGPSKMQNPILEELKKKFGDKVEFKKVDVDTNHELTAKYNIHAIPTLIILDKDGSIFKRYIGVTKKRELEVDIDALLRGYYSDMKR